jgi:hypothetical protein
VTYRLREGERIPVGHYVCPTCGWDWGPVWFVRCIGEDASHSDEPAHLVWKDKPL